MPPHLTGESGVPISDDVPEMSGDAYVVEFHEHI